MINRSRLAALGAVLATLAIAAPANAAPLGVAASPLAKAKAQIVKPITFISVSDLNFGTIVLGTLTANTSVAIGKTAGAVAVCGTNLTCSGASQPAQYNVRASPSQPLTVRGTLSKLSLVGATGVAPTIDFTPDVPASFSVPNASVSGYDFYVGGSIVITPTTPEGVYQGTMDVTVDYN
jgi:hypothetical protein